MVRRPSSLKKSKANNAGKARGNAPRTRSGKAGPKGQWVYTFGGGKAQGRSGMKDLLGGKGANLAEMANLGLPVPPGFTITTAVCTHYYANAQKYPRELEKQIDAGLAHIARVTGRRFGDRANPLLLSVRSGARASMPGMMDTVLNLGLNDATVAGLARKTNNARFPWDQYGRFVMMFATVALGVPREPFEAALEELRRELAKERH